MNIKLIRQRLPVIPLPSVSKTDWLSAGFAALGGEFYLSSKILFLRAQ